MPIDYRLVADLEEGLGDEHLSEIRFGRSRFLRNAGLALFGLAAGVFAAPPQEAEAAPPAAMGTGHAAPAGVPSASVAAAASAPTAPHAANRTRAGEAAITADVSVVATG